MKFEKHIPSFVDCERIELVEVNNLDDILDLNKAFSNSKNFHRFSLVRGIRLNDRATLMAEMDNGYSWWVCGYISPIEEAISLNLPEWESKYLKNGIKDK